jgi:hypothetical protein
MRFFGYEEVPEAVGKVAGVAVGAVDFGGESL